MHNKMNVDFHSESTETKPYLESFKTLTLEIQRRGLYQRDVKRIYIELLAHILITIAGIILFVAFENTLARILSSLIMASGLLGIGTHTHNSAHNASTEKKTIDEFLSLFGYSVVLGFSAIFWKYKHNIVHHSNPNIIGVDEDVNLMPFFAVTEMDAKNAGFWGKFYYRRLQGIVFPFMISLTAFNIQRQAWAYLIPVLMNKKRRKTVHWVDLACNGLHILTWLILPMLFFAPLAVIEFYILRNVLIGYALFFMLGSSHLPNEAVCSVEDQKHQEFALKQTVATINIRTNWYGRFIMAGLDYQIDHHLFRGISYTRLPEVSELVKEYCKHHNYPHRTLGVLEAGFKTIKVFYKPKPVQTDLRKLIAVDS